MGLSIAGGGSPTQRGVSLIEVLVAMLVVSFGVLAVTGLMANAARYGKTSEFRSVATLLAADMADRMRANKLGVNAGAYAQVADYAAIDAVPAVPACALPDDCTMGELAAVDLAEWRGALFSSLPGADGFIVTEAGAALDPNGNPIVTGADVWVAWLDPEAAGGEAKAYTDNDRQECPPGYRDLTPQPRCLYVRVGF